MKNLLVIGLGFLALVSYGNFAEALLSKNVRAAKGANEDIPSDDIYIRVSNVTVMPLKSDFGSGQMAYGNVSAVGTNWTGDANGGSSSVKGNFTTFDIAGSVEGSGPGVVHAFKNTSVEGAVAHLTREDNKTVQMTAVHRTVIQHGEQKVLSKNMRMQHTGHDGNERVWPAMDKHEQRSTRYGHKSDRRQHLYHRQNKQKQVIDPQMKFYLPNPLPPVPDHEHRRDDDCLMPQFDYSEQPVADNFMESMFGGSSRGDVSLPENKLSNAALARLMRLTGNAFEGSGKSSMSGYSPARQRNMGDAVGFGFAEDSEDKLLSFLQSMRGSKSMAVAIDEKNKMYTPRGQQYELEIRCPIHHDGAGKDTLGICTCDVLKN